MDPFADQVHADGGADGGDVPGAQELHDGGQGLQHVLFGDDDFGVVRADIIRDLAGIFQVDGVDIHADGEGADGMREDFLRDCADKGGIQAAGEQEAHRSVRVQPFSDAVGQQPVQFPSSFSMMNRSTWEGSA